jgi:hypothetical protein
LITILRNNMKNFIIILIAICFVGCSGKKGFVKYAKNNPEVLAKECFDKFPTITRLIKGKIDTLYLDSVIKGDSIPCPQSKEDKSLGKKPSFAKCPDVKQSNKYFFSVDTLYQKDSACNFLNTKLNLELIARKADIKQLKSEKTSLKLSSFILFLGLIAAVYFYIKK